MSHPLSDLEAVLRQLIGEHRRLAADFDAHHNAMAALDAHQMHTIARRQDQQRLRLASLDTRRKLLVNQLAKLHKRPEREITLTTLAALHPTRKAELLKLRAELRQVIAISTRKGKVTGRVANAVLGHLNTVVRLIAGAVESAGLYTKSGVPRVSARIGVMEAVG